MRKLSAIKADMIWGLESARSLAIEYCLCCNRPTLNGNLCAKCEAYWTSRPAPTLTMDEDFPGEYEDRGNILSNLGNPPDRSPAKPAIGTAKIYADDEFYSMSQLTFPNRR